MGAWGAGPAARLVGGETLLSLIMSCLFLLYKQCSVNILKTDLCAIILVISFGKIPVSGIAKSKGMNASKAIVLLCQKASHKVVPLMLEEISTKNCYVE